MTNYRRLPIEELQQLCDRLQDRINELNAKALRFSEDRDKWMAEAKAVHNEWRRAYRELSSR